MIPVHPIPGDLLGHVARSGVWGGPSEERFRAGLAMYRANPDAMTFALLRQHSFMPNLPDGFVYPIQIIEELVRAGQHERRVREGQPKLLAAIFTGCLLRPLIVSQLAGADGFDPLRDTAHDQTIMDPAWSAIAAPRYERSSPPR